MSVAFPRRPAHLVILDELRDLSLLIVTQAGDQTNPMELVVNRAVVVPAKTALLIALLAKIELNEEEMAMVSDDLRTAHYKLTDDCFEDRLSIKECPDDRIECGRMYDNIEFRENHIRLLKELIERYGLLPAPVFTSELEPMG